MTSPKLRGVSGAFLCSILFLGLGGCGVSQSDEPPGFEVTGIGSEGGEVEAGDVFVDIPPGALTEPTQVSILPEKNPFDIVANDNCDYSYLGPLWCVGPVGQELLVDALLRVTYDPSLIPDEYTAADLVLLIWDDQLQALVPQIPPGDVTHNVAESYFEQIFYGELGHLAVGIRDCPQVFGNVVVAAGPNPNQLVGGGSTEGGGGPYPGLYIVDIDSATPTPVFLDTEHDGFNTPPAADFAPSQFIPSPDGTRILYDGVRSNESTVWKTIAIDPGAMAIDVIGDPDQDINNIFSPFGDPFIGWLLDQTGPLASSTAPSEYDVYFRNFGALAEELVDGTGGTASEQPIFISRRQGDVPSNVPPAFLPITSWPADATTFIDMRQSADGAHMIVFIQDQNQLKPGDVGAGRYDIINIPNGQVVHSFFSSADGGQFIPRFLPDGTGYYHVDANRLGVSQYDLDGSNPSVLWAPTLAPTERIVDYAIRPDGTHFAAITRDQDQGFGQEEAADTDFLYFGVTSVTTGFLEVEDLGGFNNYREVVFHPDGDVLYIDCSFRSKGTFWSVIPFTLDETLGPDLKIFKHPMLLASGIERLDINSQDGRLLQVQLASLVINLDGQPETQQQQPTSNIWVSDKVGANPIPVPLPDPFVGENARWMFTVRTAPGMADNSFFNPGSITPGIR